MKTFSQMNELERLELARGNPSPVIDLNRKDAEEIMQALLFAGQHRLAAVIKDKMQWA